MTVLRFILIALLTLIFVGCSSETIAPITPAVEVPTVEVPTANIEPTIQDGVVQELGTLEDIGKGYDSGNEGHENDNDHEGRSPETVQLKTSEEIASRYPVWGAHCNGNGPVMFANSPMRIEDIKMILPYGDVVGAHITPIDHMYFEPLDRTLGRDVYEVRAIQDAIIYDISTRDTSAETNQKQFREWRIDMAHSCSFSSYFDLLTSLVPEIEQEWQKSEGGRTGPWDGVQVTAGQLIGYIGAQTLDFGVYDWEIELPGLINPSAYAIREPWKIHTVDPFQYFPSDIRGPLLKKMIRAVEPRAGRIDYDIDGTLSGNWFQIGTDGYNGINQRKYWDGHLSVAPHQITPDLWRVGIGYLDRQDNNFIIIGDQKPSDMTSESGLVYYKLKRYLVHVPAKPNYKWWSEPFDEGDVYGVDVLPDNAGTVLLELQIDGSLKLEAFLGLSKDQISGFTDNARLYER